MMDAGIKIKIRKNKKIFGIISIGIQLKSRV